MTDALQNGLNEPRAAPGCEKRRCRYSGCGKEFTPYRDWQTHCSTPCRRAEDREIRQRGRRQLGLALQAPAEAPLFLPTEWKSDSVAVNGGSAPASQPLELLNPIVRAADPSSSFEGAEVVTESGQREIDCLRVLAALRGLDEPVTYSELALVCGLEKHAVQKRLNDLRREVPPRAANGPKRKCAVTGVSVQTWYALEVQEQEGQAA